MVGISRVAILPRPGGAWKPDGVFYQGPLFPYLLALFKTAWPAFGPASLAAIQLLLNWITCFLLLGFFRRFVPERVALLAATFALFFSPAVFFALKASTATLGLFLFTLGLFVLPAGGGGPLWRFLLAGALTGLAVLAVPSFVLVPLAVALFLVLPGTGVPGRKNRGAGLLSPCLYVFGFLAAILPVTVSNYFQDGSLVLISSEAGVVFNHGNNAWSPGTYAALPGVATHVILEEDTAREVAQREEGRPLNAQEVSVHYFRKGLDFIWDAPLAWMVLIGRKAALVMSGLDVPHEFSLIRERRDFLPFLWAFPFGGTSILLLASLGLCAGEWRRGLLLPGLIALALGGICLVFYVGNRFAFPAHFFLMPAAGSGFFAISSLRHQPARAVLLVPVALSALWARTVLSDPFWEVDDYLPKLVFAYSETGDKKMVEDTFGRWRAFASGSSSFYLTMGHYYSQEGDWGVARSAYDNAIGVSPGAPEIWYARSLLLAKMGQDKEALAGLSKVLELDPHFSLARIARIELLELQGKTGDVEEEWRIGLALDPYSRALHLARSEWLVRRAAP
jgi:tetratricopeptide (TPR) repeat protein